jgi:hypothetical protein
MSKKNTDENDLSEFENQVSMTGQIGAGSRHASYFIVINEGAMEGNTPDEYYQKLPKKVEDRLNPNFYAYNMEKNKAGKLHIHLYLELEGNGVRFKTMQNVFPGAHIELRRGSPRQALLYLEKPQGVTFGGQEKSHTVVIPVVKVGDFAPYELIKYRRKSPSAVMKTQEKFDYFLENCNSFEEVKYTDVHFATMHQKMLESAFSEKQFTDFIKSDRVHTFENQNGNKCYTVDRKVYYLWGSSRVGKSHGVERKFGQENVSSVGSLCRGMKFDDYRETPVMILDEFYSQLSINEALGVLDDKIGYLPCRYANKRNLSTTIVLTSNDPLWEQYADQPESRRIPFLKRLTGGVWEMYRAAANAAERKQKPQVYSGTRYIACQIDGSTRAYNENGFSPCEPPVLIDESVVLVSYQELLAIKEADRRNRPIVTKQAQTETEQTYQDCTDLLPF